jgi:hypothetical protein
MRTNSFVKLTAADGGLSMGGLTLTPLSETRFESANGVELAFEAVAEGTAPVAVLSTPEGDEMRLERGEAFAPTAAQRGAYVGSYHSDEAGVTYRVAVEEGQLRVVDRYGDGLPLEPVYSDGFEGPFGTLIFRRDGAGTVNGFSVSQGRVWDLRFERIPADD